MPMSDFILANLDGILAEWQTYAQTIPPAEGMDLVTFRAHARDILEDIALDMRLPQSDLEQQDKSKGLDLHRFRPKDTPAESHGNKRYVQGFTVPQLIGEYRVLRACVTRLWMQQLQTADLSTIYALVRFNESLDQAMSESVAQFAPAPETTATPMQMHLSRS
jgi:hypothetical protein